MLYYPGGICYVPSMKSFAHWKNITPNASTVLNPAVSSDHVKGAAGRAVVVAQFIEDIPEETTRKDVVAKLFAAGIRIDETDGFGFEDEWPPEVKRQFGSDRSVSKRLRWSILK
jgi:hypothetical protein